LKFARIVFLSAPIFGVIVLAPGFFAGTTLHDGSPRPGLPFYFGFLCLSLTWQFVYVLIGLDPVRYRPMMLLAALAKLSYFAVCVVLFLTAHLAVGPLLYISCIDASYAVLFITALVRLAGNTLAPGYNSRSDTADRNM
jgi:hypothetical protein